MSTTARPVDRQLSGEAAASQLPDIVTESASEGDACLSNPVVDFRQLLTGTLRHV